MLKDHKIWSLDTGEPPPSRNIMNGKLGMIMNMSEFLSIALEPIANEDKDSMEVNAYDGLIADIERVNKKWANRQKDSPSEPTSFMVPTGEQIEKKVPEEDNIPEGWTPEHEEETDESVPDGWKPNQECEDATENNIPEGWKNTSEKSPGAKSNDQQKNDIRFYITREGKNNVLHCDVQSKGQGRREKVKQNLPNLKQVQRM